MKHTMIVSVQNVNYEKRRELEEQLKQCSKEGVGWTLHSFRDDPPDQRYQIRTEAIDTVRTICAQNGYGFREIEDAG